MFPAHPHYIAAVLAEITRRSGGFPCLQVQVNDQRIDWTRFHPFTNHGLPAADLRQTCDFRWSLPPTEYGLHGLHYGPQGYIRFHLDPRDPIRFPTDHLLRDTTIAEKMGVAGFVGFLIGGPAGAAIGVALGSLVGANTEPGPDSVWVFHTLRSDGYWIAVPLLVR